MQAIIHAADIQDRDGGLLLMGSLFGLYPFLLKLYADSGYQGPKFQSGLRAACGRINLEIARVCEVNGQVLASSHDPRLPHNPFAVGHAAHLLARAESKRRLRACGEGRIPPRNARSGSCLEA